MHPVPPVLPKPHELATALVGLKEEQALDKDMQLNYLGTWLVSVYDCTTKGVQCQRPRSDKVFIKIVKQSIRGRSSVSFSIASCSHPKDGTLYHLHLLIGMIRLDDILHDKLPAEFLDEYDEGN